MFTLALYVILMCAVVCLVCTGCWLEEKTGILEKIKHVAVEAYNEFTTLMNWVFGD